MLAGTKNCWRFIWSEAIWNGKEGYNASSDPDEMIKGYEALPNKERLDIVGAYRRHALAATRKRIATQPMNTLFGIFMMKSP